MRSFTSSLSSPPPPPPSFVAFTVTLPHPPLSSTSSSLPYVIQSELSLTLSLSQVPFPTLMLCFTHSPPSSIAPVIALIPPPLTHTISPPYHTASTLKLSFLTSLRHHTAFSPFQNSGCRTDNLKSTTPPPHFSPLSLPAGFPFFFVPVFYQRVPVY